MKQVLGIDLGLKRTGLALSDPLRISVRPLENLIPKSRAEDITTLIAICLENNVGQIVIGYPTPPKEGIDSPMATRVCGFSKALGETLDQMGLGIEVYLRDEYVSSKRAAKRLAHSGVKKANRKSALDSEVARILVEDFMQEKSQGNT